jgi:hypothetical protein
LGAECRADESPSTCERRRSDGIDPLDVDISILERCEHTVQVGLIDDVHQDHRHSLSRLETPRVEIHDQLLAHLPTNHHFVGPRHIPSPGVSTTSSMTEYLKAVASGAWVHPGEMTVAAQRTGRR